MTAVVIVVVVIVVVLVLLLALLLQRRARSKRLQEQFGDEYGRTVEQTGDRHGAEQELRERADRRDSMQIQELAPEARKEYSQRWRRTQEQFVDDPNGSVEHADRLVSQVMQERGYPTGDFEQQARDVSVDHASVVSEYRAAHEISLLNDEHRASTEQLREAMVHYRSLFGELLGDAGGTDGR